MSAALPFLALKCYYISVILFPSLPIGFSGSLMIALLARPLLMLLFFDRSMTFN